MKLFAVLCLSTALFAAMLIPATAAAAPPNVVVILADDQGWGDLGVNGNTNLSTPNIDSLARDGIKLDAFYVCPVCSPTRAEFLTGRYHPRGGVRGVSTGQERLSLEESTIADAFKAAGYATGAFGKWHNGSQWPYHPNARGFDEFYGFTSGHWGEYFDPPLERNGQPVRGKGYIADDLTNQALQFIQKNKNKPFFCYLPYNIPHSPWAVPQEFWLKFKDKDLALRADPANPEELAETRCALAMCENLDWNVGRVLKQLEALKLTGNTIVVYFSDNGPNTFRWNGGMKGKKGSTDEGGVRSPCLIRWPAKLPAGKSVKQIAGAIDLLPTLCALADVKQTGGKRLDGCDLTPLLSGTAKQWPDRMIFSSWGGNISVRTQRHRLDGKDALFDMITDPGQTQDVASQKPDIAEKLTKARMVWRMEMFGPPDLPEVALPGKPKGAVKAAGKAADPRPFPVGYPQFPRTTLPARDGTPHGNVQRSASAPNCSYFVNWRSPDDRIVWHIDVATAGDYEVEVHYTCPETDAGSVVELSSGPNQIQGKVQPAWDPPLYTNQDTLPRPAAESRMKEFRPLPLGTIRLEKGAGDLVLRAVDIPGNSVMDLRMIVLTLKNQLVKAGSSSAN